MLSDAADALQLAQSAPWLAVVIVCLVVCFWVYRQGRRSLDRLETKCARSARAQGERLGTLEQSAELERTRRLQLEDELARRGMDLPWWPPDGDRPRPLPTYEPYSGPGPWPQDGVPLPTTEAVYSPPVPPLPDPVTRHRRP